MDFFGLILVSNRGRATQHLFHGLCLDETFDSSVNHDIDTLVQRKFTLKDVRGEQLYGLAGVRLYGLAASDFTDWPASDFAGCPTFGVRKFADRINVASGGSPRISNDGNRTEAIS